MNNEKCLGIDVSKDNITCHILTEYPTGGISSYWDRTRIKEAKLYPKFYNRKQKGSKDVWDFVEYLRIEKPTIAVLEPTGVHYSKLWAKVLESLGVRVYWIGHIELKRFRGGLNLKGHTKTDAVDALAMVGYYFNPEYRLSNGQINPDKFLSPQPESILRLRQLVNYQEHLNKIQSPVINYLRQLLSWQYPEKSKTNSIKFFQWLADSESVTACVQNSQNRNYHNSIGYGLGFDLDPHLQLHSKWYLDCLAEEKRLMNEIREILSLPEFEIYNLVFDLFSFGDKIKAKMLTRIYPFENFLTLEKKEFIEYERRVTKNQKISHEKGTSYVEYQKGAVKRVKRNRSRDSFKLRLGMGTILEASGDKWKMIKHGSKLTRKSYFQYILTCIQSSKNATILTKQTAELWSYLEELENKELLGGKHIQYKMMSKVCNMLYREFVRAFCY